MDKKCKMQFVRSMKNLQNSEVLSPGVVSCKLDMVKSEANTSLGSTSTRVVVTFT